jgi:hypothetical protein
MMRLEEGNLMNFVVFMRALERLAGMMQNEAETPYQKMSLFLNAIETRIN